MNEVLTRRFAEIGARLEIHGEPTGTPSIDVARGSFSIRFPQRGPAVELAVIDVDRADRHLLLLVRRGETKSKFLCGHDERHYFVAAVPESARGVTGVATAKVALQPEIVRDRVERVRPKDGFRRRNLAYIRQGEWFFVPAPELDPPETLVRRNEPLSRGRGRAHVLELAYRRGGEPVWVSDKNPSGISQKNYARLPARLRPRYRPRFRNPELFALGAVRHPDHATVVLAGWHRVVMNTEQQAEAMRHVVFLD